MERSWGGVKRSCVSQHENANGGCTSGNDDDWPRNTGRISNRERSACEAVLSLTISLYLVVFWKMLRVKINLVPSNFICFKYSPRVIVSTVFTTVTQDVKYSIFSNAN